MYFLCTLFHEDTGEYGPQKWKSKSKESETWIQQAGNPSEKRRKGFPSMRVKGHSMTSVV